MGELVGNIPKEVIRRHRGIIRRDFLRIAARGVIGMGVGLGSISAASADGCKFANGFKEFAANNPQIGACINDEHPENENGDMTQDTQNAVLHWKKDGNSTTAVMNGDGKVIPAVKQPEVSVNKELKVDDSFKYLMIARPDITGRC